MAITTVIKRLLGVEDVNWDSDGSDSRFPVETSTGGTRSVKRVNSSDVPSTSTTRSKERIGSGTPVSGGKDVDGHLQEVYDDLAKIGEPDGVTTEVSSGQLKVKEVGAAQIGAGAVGASELATDAVETAKILDAQVTGAKIAEATIAGGNIANTTITEAQIAANAVTEAKIIDDAVTPNKLDMNGAGQGFSHYIVAAGTSPTLSLTTGNVVTVSGMQNTDIVIATIESISAAGESINKAIPAAGQFTINFTGAPTAATVSYLIISAVTP